MAIVATDNAHYAAIASAIREQNGEETTYKPEDMADAILAIEGGGGDPYMGLRQDDWMKMPATVNDDEIYLLLHLLPPNENLLSFKVNCEGNYTVTLGTMTAEGFSPQSSVSLASDAIYHANLSFNDWGNQIRGGARQLMLKISATKIKWFSSATLHSKSGKYEGLPVVEIVAKLPSATNFQAYHLRALRFFRLIGTSPLDGCRFLSCYALTAILELDTTWVKSAAIMFENCHSLQYIPEMNTANITDMNGMFRNCYSLKRIPEMNTSQVYNMSGTFDACGSLQSIDGIDFSSITIFNNIFRNVDTLRQIGLVFRKTWASPLYLDFSNNRLSRQALVNIFTGLPTVAIARNITVTGNHGAADLTAEDKAIATGKGWTVVL